MRGAKSGKEASVDGLGGKTSSSLKFHPGSDNVTVSYTQTPGMTVVDLDDGTRVVLLDRNAAYNFWVPTLSNDPAVPANDTGKVFRSKKVCPAVNTLKVLVQGPYLVRTAMLNKNTKTLELTGDLESNETVLYVFAPKSACSISWNGKKLAITATNGGMRKASLVGSGTYKLPSLGPWRSHDSLPEISLSYNASSSGWVGKSSSYDFPTVSMANAVLPCLDANKTTTPNIVKPDSFNPVLYVDDYGIHVGNHIYRATFPSTTSPPTGVALNVTGGNAFGYSAWLNAHYIGSYLGLSYTGIGAINLSFANATLRSDGQDNILVVVMDNSGHDLRDAAVNPRGVTNATILGPSDRSAGGPGYSFTSWKIAGTAGGERNIDPVRGPLNEGGLYAERIGAHLPGFSDDDWKEESGGSSLAVPGAGIKVFRTVVPLHVPDGLDVSISFRLTAPGSSTNSSTFTPTVPGYSNRVRVLLFVNGYQYGRFNPYIGNQIDFPVPPGILDYDGDNTIAVTVWSQSAEGSEVKVGWNLDYVHSSSFDMKFNGSYLRPGWTGDRFSYA